MASSELRRDTVEQIVSLDEPLGGLSIDFVQAELLSTQINCEFHILPVPLVFQPRLLFEHLRCFELPQVGLQHLLSPANPKLD